MDICPVPPHLALKPTMPVSAVRRDWRVLRCMSKGGAGHGHMVWGSARKVGHSFTKLGDVPCGRGCVRVPAGSAGPHLHEVFLQQAVHPGLRHLHGPHLVGNVAAFDQDHLQLQGRVWGSEGTGSVERRTGCPLPLSHLWGADGCSWGASWELALPQLCGGEVKGEKGSGQGHEEPVLLCIEPLSLALSEPQRTA